MHYSQYIEHPELIDDLRVPLRNVPTYVQTWTSSQISTIYIVCVVEGHLQMSLLEVLWIQFVQIYLTLISEKNQMLIHRG